MVVKDLTNSFNPYPKKGLKIEPCKIIDGKKVAKRSGDIKKKTNGKQLKTDFCIMP